MTNTNTDTAALAPAAPGSPLADLRKQLLDQGKDATKEALEKDYTDIRIDSLSRPGIYQIYCRYRLPELSHINRLQSQLGKHEKGGPAAVLSVYTHFLIQQCLGVFMVPDDDPDLMLGLNLEVSPEECEDPANWPKFDTHRESLLKAFPIDPKKATNPGRLVKEIYGDGSIIGTVDRVLADAGYNQGN